MLPNPHRYPFTPFSISSSGYPSLVFDMNPTDYDPYPERLYRTIPLASGFRGTNTDVYDNRTYTMRFAEISSGFYRILETFATPNTEGMLEQLTFTDGSMGAFRAAPIKIINVTGSPVTSLSGFPGGYQTILNYQNVEVEFIADT